MARSSLKQVGFREDVARANGFAVSTTSAGILCVAKAGEMSAQTCVELPGDCGSSYIGIENHGFAGALNVVTGFDVNGTVVAGTWGSTLVDQGGSSEVNFDIATGQNYWDGQREVTGLTRGPAYITLDTPYSNVLLSDGRVCFSGGPQADAVVL